MSRLTNNNKDNPILKDVGHANCKNVCEHEMFCDMCPIQEAIEKLAHYEDLEEQGRLVEQKHGHWVLRHVGAGHYWECSVCHTNAEIYVTEDTNYCANCGAKMDEVKK